MVHTKEKTKIHVKGEIIIPSILEGIDLLNTATIFEDEIVGKTWQNLSKYTEKTLNNFKNNKTQGIFLVHSLEDILGVANCFLAKWNENHPQDLRRFVEPINNSNVEKFYETFTPTEFICHYIEYVLGSRPLIAGSILAFSQIKQHCLTKTFAPLSFIIKLPAQCVVMVGKYDIYSPVVYLYGDDIEQEVIEFDKKLKKKIANSVSESNFLQPNFSLHGLIKFPLNDVSEESSEPRPSLINTMNEVAFKPFTKNKHGRYEAQIVGALISESKFTDDINYGVSVRHKLLVEAFQDYIQQLGLPCYTIKSEPYSEELKPQVDDSEFDKGQAYLFDNEDMQEYGLLGEYPD